MKGNTHTYPLADLLRHTDCLRTEGDLSVRVSGLQFDSRKVGSGDVFVAVKGTQADGHRYVAQAVAQGAAAVVLEEAEAAAGLPEGFPWVQVANSGWALGQMASLYYGEPSKRLRLVGITGTNGKTTTVTMLHRLFMALHHSVGLISTIENKIDDRVLPTQFTTPDALTLNALLRDMADHGCEYAFMEVSSHALVQGRVAGIHFAGALFSNITHDHLDYHGTFAEYIKAKKLLFDGLPKKSFALVNKDDRRWQVMLQNCAARQHTFALKSMADFQGRLLDNSFDGLQLEIDGREAWFQLIGSFNASNLLAIYGAAVLLGQSPERVLVALSGLEPARGRFQQVPLPGQARAIVDYAHTPDALKNVLETIRDIRQPGERVITVVGCGGNRDASKRPKMAAIAAQLSDRVFLTSDNPRHEDPLAILQDMEAGLSVAERAKCRRVPDRREAIREALRQAYPGDIVLVAGKGHETYQEIRGERFHFDDAEVLREEGSEIRQATEPSSPSDGHN
jgi:UDP-N-acetylmuramoyl-L-alanyl-D-glutamate--2,6-diaminopimelate ligase